MHAPFFLTRRLRNALALLAVTSLLGVPASAGAVVLTSYADEASFLNAAGPGLALADFEGLGNNTYFSLSNANEPTVPSGVVFSSTGGQATQLFVAPAGFAGQPDIATDSLFANFFGTPLIADFSPGVTAIGSDLISYVSSALIVVTVRDLLGNIQNFNVTPPQNSAAYFGVIASGGQIDRISWDPPGGITAGIDDFRFGQAAAAPEPATLVLLGLGIAGIGYQRRKRLTA